MLILTRRVGEKLIVGGNVTLTVLGVKGNQIRVGIDAPPEVKVYREEIYNKIQAEKKTPVLNEKRTSVLNDKRKSVLNNRKPPTLKDRETLVLKPKRRVIGL